MTVRTDPTGALRPVLDEVFKYQIGDLVSLLATYEAARLETEINGPLSAREMRIHDRLGVPVANVVCGRLVHECHGGIQIMYEIRRVWRDREGIEREGLQRFFEFELVPHARLAAEIAALKPKAEPASPGDNG